MATDVNTDTLSIRVRLRDAAVAKVNGDNETRLLCPSGGQALGVLSPGQRSTLDALATGDCGEDDLLAKSAAEDGVAEVGRVYALLVRLRAGHWLASTLEQAGRPLMTLVPTWSITTAGVHSAADLLKAALDALRLGEHVPGPVVLSRFAQIRRDRDCLILETPLAGLGVQIRDPAVLTIVATLAEPGSSQPAHAVEELDQATVAAVIAVLVACRMAVPAGGDEDSDPELAQWSPHELWFHTRSRQGRHELPWGGTFWARDRGFDPLPARHRPSDNAGLVLLRPDLAAVADHDPCLTDVLESRRSIREHDDSAPLTSAQLGEFLYRTARTRLAWKSGGMELVDRPYPSGGALHELELYPVVFNVEGIPPGLYHYDGCAHELSLVAGDGGSVRGLGSRAASAANMTRQPQVLIVITARFGRVMRKYQSMAYALTLKHVGVLYSTMYLVAAAMKLAPCALGGGDSDLFARASGLNYIAEASVGEFVLGSASGQPIRNARPRK